MSLFDPKAIAALTRAYVPAITKIIDHFNQQQRRDWNLLGPDEQYKQFRESQTKRYAAEATIQRFKNEKHNKTQTLRAWRKRCEKLMRERK